MQIYTLQEGPSRLIISVPHAGTFLPPHIAAQLTPIGQTVCDTDWHVDRLYAFAPALGATLLVATHSRTVVDLNRSPEGGKLYPGQAETGICPTETFDGEPLYATPPTATDVADRVATYWQPYHEALAGQIERVKALHGEAVLLDGHSIQAEIPRLFEGRLPDLNFGTNSGASCDPSLAARALAATATPRFSQVLNGRFRGGHITRHYGNPAAGVHAIQLELAQTTYLRDPAARDFDANSAADLISVLKHLVVHLIAA